MAKVKAKTPPLDDEALRKRMRELACGQAGCGIVRRDDKTPGCSCHEDPARAKELLALRRQQVDVLREQVRRTQAELAKLTPAQEAA